MKKELKLRIPALILATLMLISVLVSCAEQISDDTEPEGTEAVLPDTDPAEETTEAAVNALNILGKRDLNNTKITIYTNYYGDSAWSSDLFYPENDGDILGSAVFTRNSTVAEQYNVQIEELQSGSRTFTSKLKALVESNDSETCQLIATVLADAAEDMTKGYLTNLNNVSNINLEGSWWNQANNATWSIYGKQYFATGDITTVDDKATRVLFFNKDILKNINIDEPYQLVKDGKWTYDRFFEMVNAAAIDVGNDGMVLGTDTFGLTAQTTVGFMLLTGAGEVIVKKDSTDVPYIVTDENPDRIVDVATYLTEKLSGNQAVYTGTDANELSNFQQNRALFLAEVLHHVKNLRQQYDVNFGLLPMPKYSEDQEKYYQYAEGYCALVVAVPTTVRGTQLDEASFVLEALAIESVETVTPAFYELCLKGRYSTDYESTEMLDIITENVLTDYGDIFSLGGIKTAIKNAILNGSAITTSLKAANKVGKNDLKSILKSIEALEN